MNAISQNASKGFAEGEGDGCGAEGAVDVDGGRGGTRGRAATGGGPLGATVVDGGVTVTPGPMLDKLAERCGGGLRSKLTVRGGGSLVAGVDDVVGLGGTGGGGGGGGGGAAALATTGGSHCVASVDWFQ